MSKRKKKPTKNGGGSWPWCAECNSWHAPGNPTCFKVMKVEVPAQYTLEGMWLNFRNMALSKADIPEGSMQENEMRKAFMSGVAAAAMNLQEAANILPEDTAASLLYRWLIDYRSTIERQVVLHPISQQNQKGN